jgi:hypothetical protein
MATCSYARNGRLVRFNREAPVLPGAEPSGERPHARDTLPSEKERHTGAGGLVRSSAVKDHIAIARDFVAAVLKLVRIKVKRAGKRSRVSFEVQ